MKRLFVAFVFIFSATTVIFGFECQPPKIVANANSINMFNAEQEGYLGDVILKTYSNEFRIFDDPEINEHLEKISNRLIRHLPDSGLEYRIRVIDYPIANALNIAGGNIFVTRKLVSFARNEDELAGVIAHEFGHAVVHHSAEDISRLLKDLLGVESVTDEQDITEKFNSIIEQIRTKKLSAGRGHANDQQLEADQIGLYAMVAAGYDPNAYTQFFDRLAETEGKTGNWFGNLFGTTRPSQKRLRKMIDLTEKISPECKEQINSGENKEFQEWQAQVVNYRPPLAKEELPGMVWKRELSPKLRSVVRNMSFRSDGKLLLAQDDFSISVVQREPSEVLFQIPAVNAQQANFTPDGKEIVFITEDLRFERWDVESQKPIETSEIVKLSGCRQSKLSPDGRFLACTDFKSSIANTMYAGFAIIETNSGKKLFEDKKAFRLNGLEVGLSELFSSLVDDVGLFRISFTPDSRKALVSRSDAFRFGFNRRDATMLSSAGVNVTTQKSVDKVVVIDLENFKKVKVGGDLKKVTARPFAFIDNERIVGNPEYKIKEGGIFSFPKGKRVKKFNFKADDIKLTQNSKYIIVKPVSNSEIGLVDIEGGYVASGFNKKDAAFWENILAVEGDTGKIRFYETKYSPADKKMDIKNTGEAEIPPGLLKSLRAADISDDFRWLAMSANSGGGVWDLTTGKVKLKVPGFRRAVIDDNGLVLGEFPGGADKDATLVLFDAKAVKMNVLDGYVSINADLEGRYIVSRETLGDEKEKSNDERLYSNLRLSVKNIIENKVVWKRDFPESLPKYSVDTKSGRMLIYWELDSTEGKELLKSKPELEGKIKGLGDKDGDFLIEVVNLEAGKTVGWLPIDSGNSSFEIRRGKTEGDMVVLPDSEDRVLVYSLKDGAIKHRFFGIYGVISGPGQRIAVERYPGHLSIYDARTGEEITQMVVQGEVEFMKFNLAGDKLIVVSDLQKVYTFDFNIP